MKQFVLIVGAATLAWAFSTTPAQASSTDGGGNAETGDTAAYNMGKRVYAAKLACTGCPMAGKSLDAGMARQLVSSKGNVTLSAEETKALNLYLARRFKL